MTHIKVKNATLWISLDRGRLPFIRRRQQATDVGANIVLNSNGRRFLAPLRNISLSISKGQRVGLIGSNGAGKTTLLRVLSGTIRPQEGKVEVDGRVTSLLHLGAAVDRQMSGRNNAIQRALWLGHSMQEIKDKLPEIEEFSALGAYLDERVSIYSAGMLSRLLFSTVTAFDPEILLLDEGIIAGDKAFQKKARERAEAITDRASIMVLASHSQALLKSTCTHCLWLEKGRVKAFGEIGETLDRYNSAQN